MKITIVGCGDAFGSGGRSNTCFRVDAAGRTVLADFGASALVAWSGLRFDTNDIDGIALSHLHGDHFGGLPFLILQAEFEAHRTKPLDIAGPPGLRARLDALCEAMFPGMMRHTWSFPLNIKEVTPGQSAQVGGLLLNTIEVIHPSGAPATGLRLSDGEKLFAYSGDTAWTDAVFRVAEGADLMMMECYAAQPGVPHHIDWPTLRQKLPLFSAKRTILTHLGEAALAMFAADAPAGVEVAQDGAVYDV